MLQHPIKKPLWNTAKVEMLATTALTLAMEIKTQYTPANPRIILDTVRMFTIAIVAVLLSREI
jgi:hypothetical protein